MFFSRIDADRLSKPQEFVGAIKTLSQIANGQISVNVVEITRRSVNIISAEVAKAGSRTNIEEIHEELQPGVNSENLIRVALKEKQAIEVGDLSINPFAEMSGQRGVYITRKRSAVDRTVAGLDTLQHLLG